ncbi:UPF0606 protein KIAA1549L homolog isoform X2 [Rana temporaria]|uniref:UPF0606 protein KIAA1549L homolog isoform X2 n=1 Tax=Rana temporaria TaxID=8407 RepID=UPI001AAC6357|nr:UPF0606 protein KIAA1549L homolog isoform X2 [Rana temporaria]
MAPADKWLGGPMVPQGWTAMRRPHLGPSWTRRTAVLMLLLALVSALQHPTQGWTTDESILTSDVRPSEEPSPFSAMGEVFSAMEQTAETGNVNFHNNTTQSSIDVKDNFTSQAENVQDNTRVQLGDSNPSESSPLSSLQPTDSGLSDTSTSPLLMFPNTASSYASTLPATGHSLPLSSSSPLSSSLPNQSSLSDKSSTNVPYTDTEGLVALGTNLQETLNQDTVTNIIYSTYIPTSNILIPQTTSLPRDTNSQTGVFMEGSTTVEPRTVELTSRVPSTKPFIEVTSVEQTYSSVEPTATVHTSTPVTPSIEALSLTNLPVTIGLENSATDVSTSDSETGTSQTTITLNTSSLTTNPVSKSSAIMDSLNTIDTHIFAEINTARTTKETISETLGITVTTPFHYTTTEIGEAQGITGTANELSPNVQSDNLQSTTPPELHITSESSNEVHTSIKVPIISGVFTSLRTSPTEQSSTSTPSEYTSSSYFFIDTVSSTIQPTTVSKLLSVETMTSESELTNSESAKTIIVATDNVDTTFSSTSVASPIILTLFPSLSSEANTHSSVTSFTFDPSSTANSDITQSITEESTNLDSTNTKSTTLANVVSSSTTSHTEEITSQVSIGLDTTANTPTAVALTDDTVSTPDAIQNETTIWNVTKIPSFTSKTLTSSSKPSFTESATETSSSITTFVTSTPDDNTVIYQTDSTGITNNPTVSENHTVFITAITNVKPTVSNMSPSDELTTSANNIVEPNTDKLITTSPLRKTTTLPLTNAISDSLTTWVIPDVSTNSSPVEVSASTLTTSETSAPSMSTDTPSIDMHTENPYSYTPISNQENTVLLSTMTDFGTSTNNIFITTSSQESPVSLSKMTDFGTSKNNDFLTTSSQESLVSLSTMTDTGTSKNNDFLTTSSQESPVSLSTMTDFGTSKNNDFLTTSSQESTISLSTMTDFETSKNDASLTNSSQESPVSLSTMTDFGTSKNNDFLTTSSQESPVSLSTMTDFGTSKNNDFLTTSSQESTISLSTMTDFETSKNDASLTNSSQESPVSLSTMTDFGTSKNNDFLTTSSQESTISLSTITDFKTSKNNDFLTTSSQESPVSLSTMTDFGTSKNNDFFTPSNQESPVSLSTISDFGTSKNNDFLTTSSQESTVSLSTMTDFETSKDSTFLTNSKLTSNFGTSMEQNTNAPQLTTNVDEKDTSNLMTSQTNNEISTGDSDLTSPSHLLNSLTTPFSSPSKATSAATTFVSTWTSNATSETEADIITEHNTKSSAFSSITQTEPGTSTSTGSSMPSFSELSTYPNTDAEQSISPTVSDVTSVETTPINILTSVTVIDYNTEISTTALPSTLNTTAFSSSQGAYTAVVETSTQANLQPTLTAEVISEPAVYTPTNTITKLPNIFSTVSSFQTSLTRSAESQTEESNTITASTQIFQTSIQPSQPSYSSSRTVAHLSMSTLSPSITSNGKQDYINQTSQETSPSTINETFSTTESSVSQPTSGKGIEPEATSTNTYSLFPTNSTNTFNLSLSSESTTSSTHMQTTGGNITITQHNTTDTAETLTYSGSTTYRETLSTVTESITQAISNTMSSTISHLPPSSITSPFSSTFPYKTAIVPTNISGSFSTVSTMSSSAEVSSVSPAGNATKNFTTVPSSSYITHTVSTSHASVANTLLTALITRTPQVQTSNVVTSKPTNFTIANHTTYTPVTVVTQTAITSNTVLVPPSSTNTTTPATSTTTTTHAPTTHVPTTITATPLLDTTTTLTAHPRNITTSAVTSIVMSTKTTKAPLVPVSNATTVLSTILSTILSTSATTPVQFGCRPSSETMIRTVLTLSSLPTSDEAQRLRDFLSSTLSQALTMTVQVLDLTVQTPPSRNLTVGYSVSVNSLLYIPSAIVSVLTRNGVFNVSRLGTIIPSLLSVPVIAETWKAEPALNFRLKTVLKLMGTGGDVNTCVYVRSMEQKLQMAFAIAELNSMGTQSNLSVQILSTSKEGQFLTLVYVVKKNSEPLNGTTASSLLNVLSGEVVGYYLGDPPSVIAEPLYYPNLDISNPTMSYWVTTVLQGVPESQLQWPNNQSFAKLMEERLATLFQLSSQQSRRFKRATTVKSYTVQMVTMKLGANNLTELTYYALKGGQPIPGTVAAKQLSTIDPQTMALTLGYIVKAQANPVVQNPPNNLWIIAAVLAPIAVVTVIIIIITAVLCRKNKSDFKSDNLGNLPPRTKPVQGFDYAKQHLGQQGGDEDALPVTHETVVPSLNLSQERDSTKDGSTEKMLKSSDTRKSRSPCENGSVISNESEEASSDGSTPQKLMAQHRMTKDEACKWNVPISDEEEGNIHFDKNNKMVPDPFDSSSGSVQLIAIKPVSMPPSLSVTDRNQEMSIINGEVNKALKQKSDIEHYRNKLRLKAKRKGYYDFPPIDNRSLNDKKRKAFEKTQMEIDNVLEGNTDSSPPFVGRQPSLKNHPYRSRQSLNSPSPGETEMDLLVTRERPRRGIRNSGYDTEPEIIEETNIDRVKQARTYIKSRQGKGHSETSTLSSQPSIDEVRQQMHMLLEEAFSLASAGHGGPKRQADPYASAQHMPYSEVVTSAPGTMSRPRMQWVPTYGPEMYQYSLPRPTYRFSQLPEMAMGSPPPPVPPRTGPVAVPSLRRSTSDMTNKNRVPEPSGNEQSPGNTVPAVFAIPGNRATYTGYYIPQPPAAYRNHAWMSYSGENDLPGQWADSAPLPGYIEAYPRSRYPQNSPSRLPRQFGQPVNLHPGLDHAAGASIGASQQSLADTDTPDASITNLSTAALVKAIREEVAKLAKKQTDMFEFQV